MEIIQHSTEYKGMVVMQIMSAAFLVAKSL